MFNSVLGACVCVCMYMYVCVCVCVCTCMCVCVCVYIACLYHHQHISGMLLAIIVLYTLYVMLYSLAT